MDVTRSLETPITAEDVLHRRPSFGERVQQILHGRPALSPAIVLVLACIAFSFVSDRFLRPENLSLVAQQTAVVGSLAAGQTLIILTAGVDLSIGAIMVLSSLVMSKLVFDHGVPGVLALLIGAVLAVVAQAVNGLLVARIKLPPFIVTLGTLGIFTAITLIYAKGQTVTLSPDAANLESITAVVIGGTSLFGGRGVVMGSLIGALIVQVFKNGLALGGYDPNYQVLAVGVLVIVAVSVDQWIRRVKA